MDKSFNTAMRNILIIIAVPTLCLAWHYYGALLTTPFGSN